MNATGLADRPVAVDPRIAARRREVRAEGRRRRHRLLAGMVALAALVAAVWGLSRSPVADVDVIEVRGSEHTTAEQVVATAEVSTGQPLLDLDPGLLGTRVEALPWVARAQVSRNWREGSVVIEVLERTPVAVVDHPSSWSLVDAGGHVVASVPRQGEAPVPPLALLPAATGLPLVQGVEPAAPGQRVAEDQAGPALAVAAALTPGVAEQVSAVRMVEGRPELVLESATGGWVRLCDATQLDLKLRTLATVLDEVDLTDVGMVDVCVGDTAVLTRGAA